MAETELLNRHFNLLTDDSRFKRKRALETIKKETLDRLDSFENDVRVSLFRSICPAVVTSISDDVEKHRETALTIIEGFIDNLDNVSEYLGALIPVLHNRIASEKDREPSEEIRLQLLELCFKLITKSKKEIAAFLEEVVRICICAILDPFHDIKKVGCKCASAVAKKIPEYFRTHTESFIKPLTCAITHQHHKVRVEVVYAIGDVIQFGDNKFVDDVASHLAQRLFDQVPKVRKSVIEVVGNWLLDLPDRYSFFHKLLPLLLTGYADEVPEIVELTDQLWFDIGIRFERENEQDFKDKADYEKPSPSHYPTGIERPNLGCRGLMYRNISRILPALARDLTDWVSGTRVKAAQLLVILAINAEDCMTQHMEVLLNAVYRAASDDEVECRRGVQRASEIVSHFVEPPIWWHLLRSTLSKADTNLQRGVLSTLAAFLKGADRAAMLTVLPEVTKALLDEDVCHAVSVELKTQLCRCLEAILLYPNDQVKDLTTDLMILLHTVMGLQDRQDPQAVIAITDTCRDLVRKLATSNGFEEVPLLYRQELPKILDILKVGASSWTRASVEPALFECLLLESGSEVGRSIEVVVPLLCCCLRTATEVEFRMRFCLLLTRLLSDPKGRLNAQGRLPEFAMALLGGAIIPNCQWRAGRTAEALRGAMLAGLWAFLLGLGEWNQRDPEEGEMELWEKLRTQLLSLIEDDCVDTRKLATRCLRKTLQLRGARLDRDELHKMYPSLLKRLDDPEDEIRLKATQIFHAWLDVLVPEFNASLYCAHLEDIYRGLLVHMDDIDAKIQEAVFSVLKRAGALKQDLLEKEIRGAMERYRPETRQLCERLLRELRAETTS